MELIAFMERGVGEGAHALPAASSLSTEEMALPGDADGSRIEACAQNRVSARQHSQSLRLDTRPELSWFGSAQRRSRARRSTAGWQVQSQKCVRELGGWEFPHILVLGSIALEPILRVGRGVEGLQFVLRHKGIRRE